MSQMFYTLGYQRKKIEPFIQLLKEAKVDTLFDIRSFPQSKWPSPFNSDVLKRALERSEISYKWEPKLGGKVKYPNAIRKAYLPKPEDGNTAFMCFEESIYECHRLEIAELVERIFKCKVTDLTTPKNAHPKAEQASFL